jgi:hypothetical protein
MHLRPIFFGVVGGLLFFAHAMLNNSHTWPLVWPFLAGAPAVWTERSHASASYGADIARAVTVGIVAGSIFILATAVALAQLGISVKTALTGLATAAAIGLTGAIVGGALVHPLASRT